MGPTRPDGPTRIVDVRTAVGVGGFFNDDQAAIRGGASADGGTYHGDPVTPGFSRVRQPADALSILLVLDDGQVAHGDAVGVQYPGIGGREPRFEARAGASVIASVVAPALLDQPVTSWRDLLTAVQDRVADGLSTPLWYGLSQALLDAVARARRTTMAEVIRAEFSTGAPLDEPVPVFGQSGDERHAHADRMILNGLDVLPHGLFNQVGVKTGERGERLADYVRWLRDRVERLAPHPGYRPRLHLDVYGTVGLAFDQDLDAVAAYLARLAELASPYTLQVEAPIDLGTRADQIAGMRELREALRPHESRPLLVIDEWCNTLEDVLAVVDADATDIVQVKFPDLGPLTDTVAALLACKRAGVGAYAGGSCTETERSAQITAHVAMACMADQVLAKPGMGVNEGVAIVRNEMARVVALAAPRA